VAGGLASETTELGSPAPLPSRWTVPSARQIDGALTLAALVLTAALLATRQWPADAPLAASIVLPIAWLRRMPLPAAAVSLAATLAYSAVARPADPPSCSFTVTLAPQGFTPTMPTSASPSPMSEPMQR
jgi:hypothetical protein